MIEFWLYVFAFLCGYHWRPIADRIVRALERRHAANDIMTANETYDR